jgi:hypothetical protein
MTYGMGEDGIGVDRIGREAEGIVFFTHTLFGAANVQED